MTNAQAGLIAAATYLAGRVDSFTDEPAVDEMVDLASKLREFLDDDLI